MGVPEKRSGANETFLSRRHQSNMPVTAHRSSSLRCTKVDSPVLDVKIRCVGNYDLGRTIGKGQFGKVKLATHVLTGEKVAIKIINKVKLNQKALQMVQREIRILKTLSHPNIVKLYEVLETDRILFLIMEHASGGEALDFVVTHGRVTEDRARVLFRQLVSAIGYCHSMGIAHRDLKAENLLLDALLNVKVIDFGLANFISSESKLNTPCGSPKYVAPELIRKEAYDGPEVDIWAMGVVLFVFLCGHLPFKGNDLKTLFQNILHGQYELSDSLSSDCRDLIESMLEVDTAKRITVPEILNHPWVTANGTWESTPDDLGVTQVIDSLDPTLTKPLESMGFAPEDVLKSLQANEYNQATATYHLLLNRKSSSRSGDDKFGTIVRAGSTPATAAPTPTHSLPGSPCPSTKSSPPQHSYALRSPRSPEISPTNSRRSIQAERFRGHKRTRSGVVDGNDRVSRNPSEPSAFQIRKHARINAIRMRNEPHVRHSAHLPSGHNPSIPLPQQPLDDDCSIPAPMEKEPSARLVPSDPPKKEKPEEEAAPRPITRGHRRTKSEDVRKDALLEPMCGEPLASAQPATKPLWSGVRPSSPDRKYENILQNNLVRRLTEHDLEQLKQVEENERKQISSAPTRAKPEEPKRRFSSLINWTRQMLNRRVVESTAQPREVRTSFSSSTTSSRPPEEILLEVERVFDMFDIGYEIKSPYYLRAKCNDVEFELEICIPPNLTDIYVLRLQRISGDWQSYHDHCRDLLDNLRL